MAVTVLLAILDRIPASSHARVCVHAGLDEFLFGILVLDKPPLANVILALGFGHRGSPDLVREFASLLALAVLEGAARIQARVVFACHLDVCELAAGDLAVCAIAAHWHVWVAEGTSRIRAVGLVLAFLFCLMCKALRGGRMTSDTFAVLAGCAEGAWVRHVNRSSFRSSGRLMRKGAVFVGTMQVILADCICGLVGSGGL